MCVCVCPSRRLGGSPPHPCLFPCTLSRVGHFPKGSAPVFLLFFLRFVCGPWSMACCLIPGAPASLLLLLLDSCNLLPGAHRWWVACCLLPVDRGLLLAACCAPSPDLCGQKRESLGTGLLKAGVHDLNLSLTCYSLIVAGLQTVAHTSLHAGRLFWLQIITHCLYLVTHCL